MAKWLVKSDPETYSWEMFAADRITNWDGVRNFQARNNLEKMQVGDDVLFYHSNQDRAVLGTASVSKESFEDSTSNDPRWLSVELRAGTKFDNPVTLEQIKKRDSLKNIALVKQSRLSVMPLEDEEYDEIVELSNTAK